MIVTENITRDDGAMLIRTYSDTGMMVRQNETGAIYSEAVDVENAPYTYTETNIEIEDADISAEEALDILMGGDGNADDAQDGAAV